MSPAQHIHAPGVNVYTNNSIIYATVFSTAVTIIILSVVNKSTTTATTTTTRKLSYRKDDRAMRAVCMGWVP